MGLSDLLAEALPKCRRRELVSGTFGDCAGSGSGSRSGSASLWGRFSHAMCVLPSVPEKRCFLGPVCSCVVGRDGPSFLPPGLSLYLLLVGSEGLNVTAQDQGEKRRRV